ncbi:MAG: VOC family protein [Paracoccaceae bacterium]
MSGDDAMLETTAPILPSRDFDATAAFYAKFGFEVTGRYPQYLIIVRDKVELHFFEYPKHVPESSYHAAYIRSSDIDTFSAELVASDIPTHGIPRYGAAEDKDWGMREAIVVDPDGTLLRIGSFWKTRSTSR